MESNTLGDIGNNGWVQPTIILCIYGFFKDMKPSEAYLTPYLSGPFKNITKKAIDDEIYPVSTYTYFLFLFLVLMTTDFLRYKPLVIVESLAYLATRVILIWGQGIPIMKVMQATYGLATATEIAYYSYIYAIVEERHFQKVTSYTRLVVLLGKGIGDLLGQIIISTNAASLLVLNYISFASVSIAVIVSFFLPKVSGVFSNQPYGRMEEPEEEISGTPDKLHRMKIVSRTKKYFQDIWMAFRNFYTSQHLLKWSLWWALSMCGGLQIEDYAMNLWSDLQDSHKKTLYNGAVFAGGTLLSALCVFLFSFCKFQGQNFVTEIILGGLSIVQGVVVFTMGLSDDVTFAYIGYVIFRASFAFSITMASYEIARELQGKSYGLIFGWNTLIAVGLQSILTSIVADKNGLDLDMKNQFLVYGVFFGCIALIFLCNPMYVGICAIVMKCCRKNTGDDLAVNGDGTEISRRI